MKKIALLAAIIGFPTLVLAADRDQQPQNTTTPAPKQTEQPKDDRTEASKVWNDQLKQPVQQIGSVTAEQSKRVAEAVKESKEVKGAVQGVKNFNERRKKWF